MNDICDIHNQSCLINFKEGCNKVAISCRLCLEQHNHNDELEHKVITSYFLTELKSSTKKNRIRGIVERYFQSKKQELLRELDTQLADIMKFLDEFPSVDPLQQLINHFLADILARPLVKTCHEISNAYLQIQQYSKTNPNPESESNEQEHMKMFERFEQYSLQFKINSNHALKDLKKRIEGALKVDVPEPLTTKKHYFSQSNILNSLSDCKLICSFLNNKVRGATMLYRATEHEFCARVFHGKCDGIRNTLTVLRNDLKKTIGGFSPLPWQSNLGYTMDIQKETFIFSMDLREKMHLVGKYGIWNSSSYGPAFGYGNFGHDLCICDRADKNKASYAEFPLSFNNEKKYENDQKTWELFCGQKKGNNFIILQWEVWKIEFQQQ